MHRGLRGWRYQELYGVDCGDEGVVKMIVRAEMKRLRTIVILKEKPRKRERMSKGNQRTVKRRNR